MAVGIFSAEHSLVTQAIGVLAYGAFSFPAALLIFFGLKQTVGLRVSSEEEAIGLDVGEHGMETYGGFMTGGSSFGSGPKQESPDLVGISSPAEPKRVNVG